MIIIKDKNKKANKKKLIKKKKKVKQEDKTIKQENKKTRNERKSNINREEKCNATITSSRPLHSPFSPNLLSIVPAMH